MKRLPLYLLILSNITFAQENKTETVQLNSEFSYRMLEQNQDLRKVNILLEERKDGNVKDKTLIIGTSLIAIMDYQVSNMDSKFGYLMRHPTATNQIGTEVSEAAIHSAQVSLTGSVNNWITSHAEILYNPQQSFGIGIITDLNRNQLQLRKGFVVLGDLNDFPLYGAIGKMDAPFGQTGSVSPFTNSTMWHAFGGLGYGAQLGFKKWNLHATLMAVQGGAQFRAMSTIVGDTTNVPSRLNNFTADLNYTIHFGENVSFLLGGSYLHGSAYNHGFPVEHFEPGVDRNPAYTAYGSLRIKDRFVLKGGFAKTLKVWEGTHNPNPPLNIYPASKVSSLDIGSKFDINPEGKVKYTVSGEFSNFISGPDGAPWERQNQIILGFSGMVKNSSRFFVELFRTDGYVPLNFISGSAPMDPFPVGVTHSSNDAFSHGIVIGAMITL